MKLNKHNSKGKVRFKLWMKRIAWSLILLFSWEQPFWITPDLLSHPLSSPAATAKKIFHPSKGPPEVSTQEEPHREDMGQPNDQAPPEGLRNQGRSSRNPILKWVSQVKRGFTLLEIVIVLAIIAILAAVAIPPVYQLLVKAQQEAVRQEMKNLKLALIGNPGLGTRTDFGYLGDVGSLPENPADLDKLVMKKSAEWNQPDWSFDRFLRVGAGWSGPYITGTFTEENLWFKADEWGNEYTFDTNDYTNLQGDQVDAKIQSWGPDEAPNTDDDITVEILKIETTGTVFGYINMTNNKPLPFTSVSIHYPKDGRVVSQTTLTDDKGFYQFNGIPYGVRSVSLGSGAVGLGKISYVPNSVTTTGNGKNVLFSVQNVSPSKLTFTSLKVELPAYDFYETVKVNGTTVFSRTQPRIGSGETIFLDMPFTLPSGSLVQTPQEVTVDKPTVRVPAIVMASSESTQGTIQIELEGFSDRISGPSHDSDMRDVSLTITFNDESVIRLTVPVSAKGGNSEPVGFGPTAVPPGLAGVGLVFITALGDADRLEAQEPQLEKAEAELLRAI